MSRGRAGGFLVAVALAAGNATIHGAASEARVTQVIRVVNLLPNESSPKPATVNDVIHDDTGVRTGDNSKSELTFPDLTITRLGANSIYSFNRAGRSVDLGGGSILLRRAEGFRRRIGARQRGLGRGHRHDVHPGIESQRSQQKNLPARRSGACLVAQSKRRSAQRSRRTDARCSGRARPRCRCRSTST